MGRSFIIVFLAGLFITGHVQAQSILKGTVLSLNGQPLPKAHVHIEPWADHSLFDTRITAVDKKGHYHIAIPETGLYRLRFTGVMHKPFVIPLWFINRDSLTYHIRLDPRTLDDGRYFDRPDYLEWTRIIGNFNNYNYDQGIIFTASKKHTLSATIHTHLDTVSYRIIGLTSGSVALPGAADYRLNDRGRYDGLLPVKNNTVNLVYRADSVYYPDGNISGQTGIPDEINDAMFSIFPRQDAKIQEELISTYLAIRWRILHPSADSTTREKYARRKDESVSNFFSRVIPFSFRKQVTMLEKNLNSILSFFTENEPEYHSAYHQVLIYKYIYSLFLLKNRTEQMKSISQTGKKPDLEYYYEHPAASKIIYGLPADSPLWSLLISVTGIYFNLIPWSNRSEQYLTRMVRHHPNLDLTGPVLFRLFKLSYDREGLSPNTTRYYQLLLKKFGDDNLARKARIYVRRHEQK